MTDARRLFVGVFLHVEVNRHLVRLLAGLRTSARGWRFVRDENLHVTLCFLGDVAAGQRADLERRLAALPAPPLRLGTGELGAFPSAQRPRVLWAAVEGDTEALAELAAEVSRAARAAGIALADDDRRFHAHVTLARARGRAMMPDATSPPCPPQPAQGIWLVASELSASGSRYRRLLALGGGEGHLR